MGIDSQHNGLGQGGMIAGFYWFIDGEVAGCSRPGQPERGQRRAGRDETELPPDARAALTRDLAWLRGQGIRAVLSLTETPLDEEAVARHSLEALHLPVPDLTAPTPEQLMRALNFIDRQRALARPVMVHCLVGEGRTGTVLAAHRIKGGATPEQAISEMRAIRPGAIGTDVQEQALRSFARHRDWIL